jgi:DHA1 family bicyclomycin/chloramphenicol resistance-like MFS transporter
MNRRPLPLWEFVPLVAMMFATVAFSTDAMLPSLGAIARDLTPEAPNRAQLIVTVFVLGMGLGTLVTGPLADRFGRRPVMLGGFAIFILGAGLSIIAPSLEMLLLARLLQGLGAAGPRVAALAMVRDLYEGRRMAQVMSLCMTVFTLVPAAAPLIGAGIIALTGWRGIFGAFVVFALLVAGWTLLRQPETLRPEHRRPFRPRALWQGIREVLAYREVALTLAVLVMVFGVLFTTLSVAQPVFAVTFGAAELFPSVFAVLALVSAAGGLLNARIVMRLGMRRVAGVTLAVQLVLSAAMLGLVASGALSGTAYFVVFVLWLQSIFLFASLTIGNLNALGMEPLGHLAGMGASVIGAAGTMGGAAIAIPIGLAFDGTPLPMALGATVCCALGLVFLRMRGAEAAAA